MYRVGLQFYPNQANPARQCGKGVYRVTGCYTMSEGWKAPHVRAGRDLHHPLGPSPDIMYVSSVGPVKPGSRVDPVKMAIKSAAVGCRAPRFT